MSARQWMTGGPHMYALAKNIVRWVKENGGEARYQYSAKPETLGRILIATVGGREFADPGDYIVMVTRGEFRVLTSKECEQFDFGVTA